MQIIDRMATDGTADRLNKKERLMLDREKIKLARVLGGIEEMTKLPGALFIVDIKREHLAVSEADRLGIPVFGVVDTNADPTSIMYPIPGNDDASKSIHLMVSEIADAIIEGSIARKKEASALSNFFCATYTLPNSIYASTAPGEISTAFLRMSSAF